LRAHRAGGARRARIHGQTGPGAAALDCQAGGFSVAREAAAIARDARRGALAVVLRAGDVRLAQDGGERAAAAAGDCLLLDLARPWRLDLSDDFAGYLAWTEGAGQPASAGTVAPGASVTAHRLAGMLPALVPFVNAAQDMGIFTVFVQQLTLPHGRSDSPAWLRLKCRDGKSPEYTMVGSWGAQLVDGLQPRAGDVMVQKFRPDAFVRTPLDGILRAQGIESLVIVGTTTEGCVESTVRGASYHDYYVIPVTDLITGPIAQLHANSLAFMRARYPAAESAQVLQTWRAARGAAAA